MLTDNKNTECVHPRHKDKAVEITDARSERNIEVMDLNDYSEVQTE